MAIMLTIFLSNDFPKHLALCGRMWSQGRKFRHHNSSDHSGPMGEIWPVDGITTQMLHPDSDTQKRSDRMVYADPIEDNLLVTEKTLLLRTGYTGLP